MARGASPNDGRLSALIGSVYDAALDEGLWPGVVADIARTFDSTSTAVQVAVPALQRVELLHTTDNFTAPDLGQYQAYYGRRDVWVERAAERGFGEVLASSNLIADSDFERTEFCQDFCRKVGVFYVVGSVFPVAHGEVGVLGIHRPREAGTYEEADRARVRVFLPHLRRALQLHRRLRAQQLERQAVLEALERTGTATVVAARDGAILYATPQAEALLRRGDALRAVGGKLATSDRSSAERLSVLIRGAADTAAGAVSSAGGTIAIARRDRLPLTLLVAPFRPARDGLGAPLPAAILFIRDPEAPTPAKTALQALFGLSAAEASVAAALADGRSIDEVAASHRTSLNTARTHLKAIFAKTGTNRQAQLVALLLRSVGILVSDRGPD